MTMYLNGYRVGPELERAILGTNKHLALRVVDGKTVLDLVDAKSDAELREMAEAAYPESPLGAEAMFMTLRELNP